jgi:hypothetical protein
LKKAPRCYELYKKYADTSSEKTPSKNDFGGKLIEYPGITERRDNKNGRFWSGIRENKEMSKIMDVL